MTRICFKVFKTPNYEKLCILLDYKYRLQQSPIRRLENRKHFQGYADKVPLILIQQGQQFRRLGPLLSHTGPYFFLQKGIHLTMPKAFPGVK